MKEKLNIPHLGGEPTFYACNCCKRKTYRKQFKNTVCNLIQPNAEICKGKFIEWRPED